MRVVPGTAAIASEVAGWCAPGPIARRRATSIQAVARLSAGTTSRRSVMSWWSSALQPRGRSGAWRATARHYRGSISAPGSPGPAPAVGWARAGSCRWYARTRRCCRRRCAGRGGYDGSEERERDLVQFGKRDGCGSAAVATQGLVRRAAAVVREHAEPRFGQLPRGSGGDSVAGDVQARAQRGELAGSGLSADSASHACRAAMTSPRPLAAQMNGSDLGTAG